MEIPENTGLHEEMQRLSAENYHLKNQLNRKNKELKSKGYSIKKLKDELKKVKPQKQQYKNG